MLSAGTEHISFDDVDWTNPAPRLYRAASVGNSWGVTSIGRGFDWEKRTLTPDIEATSETRAKELDFHLTVDPHPYLLTRHTAALTGPKLISPLTMYTPPSEPLPVSSSPILASPPSTSPALSSKPSSRPTSFIASNGTRTPSRPNTPRPRRRSSQQRISLVAGRVLIAPMEPPSPPPMLPPSLYRTGNNSSFLSVASSAGPPTPAPERENFIGGRSINEFVIDGEIGRGAYGLVKRAKEIQDDGSLGPPLVIKQIIKSRILADCWKKHPNLGTIPIEIYVMNSISSTSYVLPPRRPWDPSRFHAQHLDSAAPILSSPEHIDQPLSPADTTVAIVAKLLNLSDSHPPLDAATPRVPPAEFTFKPEVESTGSTSSEPIEVISSSPQPQPDVEVAKDVISKKDDDDVWVEGKTVKGHPNICPLQDFFEDNHYYYLVMPSTTPDQVPGEAPPPSDLFDLVEGYPEGLPSSSIRSYLGQIADALAFLHSRGIVHRDVKDENVVLGHNGKCILIDFGSSGLMRKNGWETFSGTLDYAGPEILRGERYYGKEQDVWAFGVVAYVLVVGECPFLTAAEAQEGLESPFASASIALDERCAEGKELMGEEEDGGATLGDAAALIRACLRVEVSARPTFEKILQSRFLLGKLGC